MYHQRSLSLCRLQDKEKEKEKGIIAFCSKQQQVQ
jgi:hypothetical protein